MKPITFSALILSVLAVTATTEEPARLKAARELVAGIDAARNDYSYKDRYVH